jgi:hypothetical protein
LNHTSICPLMSHLVDINKFTIRKNPVECQVQFIMIWGMIIHHLYHKYKEMFGGGSDQGEK